MSRWISAGDFTPKHSVRCLELQFAENEKSTFDLNPWESLDSVFNTLIFMPVEKCAIRRNSVCIFDG